MKISKCERFSTAHHNFLALSGCRHFPAIGILPCGHFTGICRKSSCHHCHRPLLVLDCIPRRLFGRLTCFENGYLFIRPVRNPQFDSTPGLPSCTDQARLTTCEVIFCHAKLFVVNCCTWLCHTRLFCSKSFSISHRLMCPAEMSDVQLLLIRATNTDAISRCNTVVKGICMCRVYSLQIFAASPVTTCWAAEISSGSDAQTCTSEAKGLGSKI